MEKLVSSLLVILQYKKFIGDKDIKIDAITLISNEVIKGSLFIAQKGENSDGHDFIESAIESGASVIVCEKMPNILDKKVTYVYVNDSHHAAGIIASWFYGFPTSQLTVIGVTGTNGKTTVATLLWQVLRSEGYKVGLISTVSNWVDNEEIPSSLTTPGSLVLQKLFRKMVDASCSHVVMEVSSHAVVQKRIAGISFHVGIFTNLTQDHLDFHKTMEQYRDAKRLFFSSLSKEAFAITNVDDVSGDYMANNTFANKITYGVDNVADYMAENVLLTNLGTRFSVEGVDIVTSLIGKFNLLNSLAVYAALRTLGIEKHIIIPGFAKMYPPPGRFEILRGLGNRIGIVDYAHTPDGLEKVLVTVQSMKKEGSLVILVFGCGGDRDITKRPLMGAVAGSHADYTIITSDNPRNEFPEVICSDIAVGLGNAQYQIIVDRRSAIFYAVQFSKPGDTIIVAGKGHEKIQIIGTKEIPFSDIAVFGEAFAIREIL